MVLYVPGTEETDPKKQNQSLQLIGGATSTNTTNIATNTANIATNTANIATNTASTATNTTNIASNTSAISALQAGPLTSGNVATQANQETATSITLAVTPGRQQFHPSAVKAAVNFTGSTGAIQGTAWNVSGVSRTSAGIYVITFVTPFSAATAYGCTVTAESGGGAAGLITFVSSGGRATGTLTVNVINFGGAFADPVSVFVQCVGDQ